MTRPHISLALMLAFVAIVGCRAQDQPGPDRAESDRVEQRIERSNDGLQQAADDFLREARGALNELGDVFQELEIRNADIQGESAGVWAHAREEIGEAGDQIESDLDSLGIASAQKADEIRARIARNIETLTHRIERAELLATDGNVDFVTAAQRSLAEIDRNIQSLQAEAVQLPMEAREVASQSVESLWTEASDVRETVTAIADAAPQVIAELRSEVAEDVASLWASVRRESFELKAELAS